MDGQVSYPIYPPSKAFYQYRRVAYPAPDRELPKTGEEMFSPAFKIDDGFSFQKRQIKPRVSSPF